MRLKGVEARLRPFHAHNEHKVLDEVVAALSSGARACLCSDAGTPGISDPGFLLVRACVEAGVEVTFAWSRVCAGTVVSGLPWNGLSTKVSCPTRKAGRPA